MYIDFMDLDTTTPKDYFLLPNIDQLFDATAGFETMSFMDAYSSYHWIQMYPRNEEKISFIMEERTYFYTRMLFGL